MKTIFMIIPALILIVSISGCGTTESLMAISTNAEIEATVISLSLEDENQYKEGGEIFRAPEDTAVVRIDKITNKGGSAAFDWEEAGFTEGNEITLEFKYTARPARVTGGGGVEERTGDMVSKEIINELSYENGHFVFYSNTINEFEYTLPGLEEGSSFKAKIWKSYKKNFIVNDYELIS